jgi:ferredoxin
MRRTGCGARTGSRRKRGKKVIMRVRIKEDSCQGHAMCALTCPEVFQTNEDTGHAFVVSEFVAPEVESRVLIARASCPEEAIEVF